MIWLNIVLAIGMAFLFWLFGVGVGIYTTFKMEGTKIEKCMKCGDPTIMKKTNMYILPKGMASKSVGVLCGECAVKLLGELK